MNRRLLERAADLHRRHRPYVMATVVWARGPSSGKQGAGAIIEADGTIHGWIGGACAEPAVQRQARRILNDGTPTLMYLGPAEELDGHTRDGVITVPISCASDGALEVFMEPVLPQPHVILIGRSPAVATLTRLLEALDWRTTVIDEGPDQNDISPSAEVHATLAALPRVGIDETSPVVVATQGHYDEAALEAALATPSPYIGLVASATRSETVLGYLRDKGYDDAALGRIHTPAGVDLGTIEHREIAVAILAELVAIKAAGGIAGPRSHQTRDGEPATAVDPVCGMTVNMAGSRFATVLDDMTYYFCCPTCLSTFEAAPAEYADA